MRSTFNGSYAGPINVKNPNPPVLTPIIGTALTVPAPVGGAQVSNQVTGEDDTFYAGLRWYVGGDRFTGQTFDYNTTYTARVELIADQGYAFSTITSGFTLNGRTATDYSLNGDRTVLTFSIPFDAAAAHVPVTDIRLTSSSTVTAGDRHTLTATVSPADATNKTILWSTDSGERASVDGDKFSATVTGTFTVTATISGGGETSILPFTKNFTITVVEPTVLVSGITITPSGAVSVEVGQKTTLTAAVTPDDADDKTVTWSSGNTSRATVNSATGEVTAVSAGEVVITATAADGSNVKATKTITVTAIPTYDVTISAMTNGSVSADPTTAKAGETITLTITPDTGYELESISAYKTDSPSTAVTLSGSGGRRTFTMPAYGVTVEATFTKGQAMLDSEAVASAKTDVEESTFAVEQADVNSEEALEAWLAETIAAILGTSGVEVETITVDEFEAAQYGTDGSFSVTVSLTKGDESTTATVRGTIPATPVTVTIVAQPAPATEVVEGSIEGSLTVEAESEAPITYQWYLAAEPDGEGGGTAIEGATEAKFTLPTTLAPGAYHYYVVVSAQGAEPVTSDEAVVTVTPAPAVPLFMGLVDEYTAGAPAVPLRTMGIGASALSTFKVNGAAATEFDPAEAGTYMIEASSSDGKLKIWKYVTVK